MNSLKKRTYSTSDVNFLKTLCSLIMDSGVFYNYLGSRLVDKLTLTTIPHPIDQRWYQYSS